MVSPREWSERLRAEGTQLNAIVGDVDDSRRAANALALMGPSPKANEPTERRLRFVNDWRGVALPLPDSFAACGAMVDYATLAFHIAPAAPWVEVIAGCGCVAVVVPEHSDVGTMEMAMRRYVPMGLDFEVRRPPAPDRPRAAAGQVWIRNGRRVRVDEMRDGYAVCTNLSASVNPTVEMYLEDGRPSDARWTYVGVGDAYVATSRDQVRKIYGEEAARDYDECCRQAAAATPVIKIANATRQLSTVEEASRKAPRVSYEFKAVDNVSGPLAGICAKFGNYGPNLMRGFAALWEAMTSERGTRICNARFLADTVALCPSDLDPAAFAAVVALDGEPPAEQKRRHDAWRGLTPAGLARAIARLCRGEIYQVSLAKPGVRMYPYRDAYRRALAARAAPTGGWKGRWSAARARAAR